MGIVFKARDRRLGRVVALKRLPDSLRNHPKAVELFLREARAAAALNHPNIVTLFDAGQDGDDLLHHDGAARGHAAAADPAPARPARTARRREARPPDRERTALRARAAHRAPRHQDREPLLHARQG